MLCIFYSLCIIRQHLRQPVVQHTASRCQLQTFFFPDKKSGSQFLLHSIDLTAQRRLRDKQTLCGFCKTQALRHGYKIFDLIKSHLPCSSLYLYAPFLYPILYISVFIHLYVRFYISILTTLHHVHTFWHSSYLGSHYILIHNPNATFPLPKGIFI